MTKKPELATVLPGFEEFLRKIGVRSFDSNFDELLAQAKRAMEAQQSETGFESHAPARWEDPIIAKLVQPGETVIDLGCGDGELLVRLMYECNARVQGVETDEDAVIRCIERGMPVCHEDLYHILNVVPDQSFNYAVLEQTLQTLQEPLKVLEGMLRVAKRSIVSFPNFAHWSVRLAFSLGGRMPVTSALPYEWYDTPNIHLCSITDFLDWVEKTNVRICQAWVLVEGKVEEFGHPNHNISAEQAMFVIERKSDGDANDDEKA
ncbi:MAG: methionine biosynthesis protein MetW [Lentisphaeria bacterium]|jgi:methionine biosynthesis protein MetW